MSGLNRKGPAGTGPMTGRQLGRCAGSSDAVPGSEYGNRWFRSRGGFGFRGGRGSGGGRGLRFRWGNPFAGQPGRIHEGISEETLLESEARLLKNQLNHVEKELQRIQNKNGEK